MSFLSICTAVALGTGAHLFYFIRGEHHTNAPFLAALVPISWTVLVAAHLRNETLLEATKNTLILLSSFGVGLYGSIITYRLFFHPLANFPGPQLAKVSKFWHVIKLSGLRNHLLLEELHHQYGDIVRIGPNEVVVFTPDGFTAIHGPGSRCTKAPWYDMLQKDRSIHATRNPDLHRTRRRIWDQGFGPKALRIYQEKVNKHVNSLTENIARSVGQSINCTQLFLFFGFDVMGDTAFGEGFGMLESNKAHPAVDIMRSGVFVIGRLTPVAWLVTVLASLPGANRDFEKLEGFSHQQVLKRAKMETDESDVGANLPGDQTHANSDKLMSKLIAAARDPTNSDKIDMRWLSGDSMIIIIAGSDTVSITLTFIFYHLAKISDHVDKLRKELEGIDISDNKALQSLPHLNGVINEALRLYPPVITAPLRQAPPEGLRIAGTFIPGGVTVSAPLWSLGRLESSYARASEFIPERWYAATEMVKDRSGFGPFLAGANSCLGKQLALMELRLVTAKLVTTYDFGFAEGDGSETLDIKDCFTAIPGPLKLQFTPRETGSSHH